jgi:hypothetical protein
LFETSNCDNREEPESRERWARVKAKGGQQSVPDIYAEALPDLRQIVKARGTYQCVIRREIDRNTVSPRAINVF